MTLTKDFFTLVKNCIIDQNYVVGVNIVSSINICDILIPIISPRSTSSQWDDWETRIGLDLEVKKKIIIIPLILEKCKIPSKLSYQKKIEFKGDYNQLLKTLVNSIFDVTDKLLPGEPPPELPNELLPSNYSDIKSWKKVLKSK